jgi:hypothetical protein
LSPGIDYFNKNIPKRARDTPLRIVVLKMRKIRYVADVIPFPVLIEILVFHLFSGQFLHNIKCFKDRA